MNELKLFFIFSFCSLTLYGSANLKKHKVTFNIVNCNFHIKLLVNFLTNVKLKIRNLSQVTRLSCMKL